MAAAQQARGKRFLALNAVFRVLLQFSWSYRSRRVNNINIYCKNIRRHSAAVSRYFL